MALDSYHFDHSRVLPPLDWDWEWDWELHLRTVGGGGDASIHEPFPGAICEEESPESSSSEASSGYLQDAVDHWTGRCKRQRMAETSSSPPRRPVAAASEDLHGLLQRFWEDSSSGEGSLFHDLNIMIPECSSFVSGAGEDEDALGWEEGRGPSGAAVQVAAAVQGGGEEEQAVAAPQLLLRKATSGSAGNYYSCEQLVGSKQQQQPSSSSSSPRSSLTGKERRGTGVLYPFAVVKPLGLDAGGTTTLSDVNQRILQRPARPVRHPVGQFACSPAVSADGLGLSGKAVVSLTRIRTAGKGTITIIRTRG